MLEDTLTVKALIIVNALTVSPLVLLGIRAVWNLSRIIDRVDKMWIAFENEREDAFQHIQSHTRRNTDKK